MNATAETVVPERPRGPAPQLVVIGVSTGGPAALGTLLPRLPANFPVPILIVQHMPPTFTDLLATRLNQSCEIAVVEAEHDMVASAGTAYIAPGSHHLRASRSGTVIQLHLDLGQPENSCRPSVDVLFRSAAMAFGDRVLGVILTGMGRDGLQGTRDIHEAGGRVIIQDEATSVVWGMPAEVAREGLADRILPLEQIASELIRATSRAIPSCTR